MKLVRAYFDLSVLEQSVLDIISIIYEATNKTKIMDSLRNAQIRPEGKAIVHRTMNPILEKLQSVHLLTETYQCPEGFVNWITDNASQKKEFPFWVRAVRNAYASRWQYDTSPGHHFRELRIAIFTQDAVLLRAKLINLAQVYPHMVGMKNPLVHVLQDIPSLAWLKKQSTPIQLIMVESFLEKVLLIIEPLDSLVEILRPHIEAEEPLVQNHAAGLLIRILICQGKLKEAQSIVDQCEPLKALSYQGVITLLYGEGELALQYFDRALADLRKSTKKKNVLLDDFSGLFYLLALLKTRDPSQNVKVRRYVNLVAKDLPTGFWPAYLSLNAYLHAQEHHLAACDQLLAKVIIDDSIDAFALLFSSLVTYWVKPDQTRGRAKYVEHYLDLAKKEGYDWLALEFTQLLVNLRPSQQQTKRMLDELQERLTIESISYVVEKEEEWERTLKALTTLAVPEKETNAVKTVRLIWFVNFQYLNFSPRIQTRNKQGTWTKGRPVALKRLASGEEIEGATEQDRKIGQTIRVSYAYYGGTEYHFQSEKTLKAMVGHPLLFLEDSPTIPIELTEGEPELWIEENPTHYQVRFSLQHDSKSVTVVRETPTRYKLIAVTEEHRKIAEILQGKRIKFPKKARSQLVQIVGHLSSITNVHSTLEAEAGSIQAIEGNPQICVHLLPIGEGFKVEMFVKPFDEGGNYYKPGKGGEHVFADVSGKKVQAKRDLVLETENAKAVSSACSSLSMVGYKNLEWILADPETCLQVLLELEEIKDQLTLEWPEGEKLRISHRASLDQMRMQIRKERDWFSVTGELKLDKGLVLDMKQLLELVQQSPGRFVPLSEGQFLLLTDAFRKRLEEINALSEMSEKGARFHPLASLALQGITDGVGNLKLDRAWNKQIKQIRASQAFVPELPSTLQAELRDYQIDGFQWLSRLAHLGVGACLADDMGLGKTLQALAVLLTQAKKGPVLVVAPTSVCFNWVNETVKFAPTLNPILFGGKQREALVQELRPFDLLICSYGLLQQETKLLTSVSWQAVVLDEAQAIKNKQTKRSQTAMKLQSELKIITTGTPIENHLGELWNLMNFINPGLLGSLEKFNARFAIPIEKNQDAMTRQRLKQLIQPFILRRTKTQVLSELPPRTEIVLHVEMNSEEAALYEALRQQAITTLKDAEDQPEQHLQILAELMKLRRACCNPQLVVPESTIPCSKLALFEDVVEELLENHHKALVFSQFVGHLSLIRERLDEKKVSYKYLDGSTPPKKRQEQIEAFQAGEGDLFLISLKAGGMGLNLTAADYVIHMDPWWNPAVEDQASDRAHRIGQKRPVTIYRLVTKGTIEEKIVDLHHHKRDLANSLLDGSEISGKLSAEELLRLIREQ